MTRDAVAGLRALVVAVVLAVAVVDATFALRWGAIACAGVALSAAATSWRWTSADWGVLALGVLPALSSVWTVSAADTELSAKNFLGCAAIFLGTRAAVVSTPTLLLVARGFIVGAVVACVQLLTSADTLVYGLDPRAQRLGLDTARGASINYLAYSFVAALAVLVLIWTTKRPALLGRVVTIVVAAGLLLGINQTGTRGAFVGVVLLAGWLLVQRVAPGRWLMAVWALAAGLNLLIVTGLLDRQLALLSGTSKIRDTGTLNGRLDTWPVARETFLDHPLIGIGSGAFPSVSPYGTAAHNVLLDLGTGLGVLGVAAFLLVVYATLTADVTTSGSHRRVLLVGAFLAAVTVSVSTGFWIEAPVLWGLLALFSRLKAEGQEGLSISRGLATAAVVDVQIAGSAVRPVTE